MWLLVLLLVTASFMAIVVAATYLAVSKQPGQLADAATIRQSRATYLSLAVFLSNLTIAILGTFGIVLGVMEMFRANSASMSNPLLIAGAILLASSVLGASMWTRNESP